MASVNPVVKQPHELQSPASSSFQRPDLEKKVVWKLDLNVIPLVVFTSFLAHLDRSNIGNAKTAGMQEALHLSSAQFQWLLTVFYFSYIFFEPLALMWKVFPPHKWMAAMVSGWAICSILQAAMVNWSGMMAARFFLGLFEAGFAPGIPYLLSFFYLPNELGLRCGLILSASPLASCISGALAYGITSSPLKKIEAWRLLFIVEGIPCFMAAALAFFLMPDRPEKIKFWNSDELAVVKMRSLRQTGTESSESGLGSINWKDVKDTLGDIKPWINSLMIFSCNVSYASLPIFLPTILVEMGFTSINAQGLSAPPYLLATFILLFTCWFADRTGQRGYTIFVLSMVGTTGYILLATSRSVAIRYFGVYLAAAGIFPSIGNILPWVMNNQCSETRRGVGVAIINMVGQCGPLLGTRFFAARDMPFYRRGMWASAAFMTLNGVLALALRGYLVRENKKLDKKFGVSAHGKTNSSNEEIEDTTFRFIL
ncbi:hypothetical protein K3495_g8116 [Podosphaera aphanis]|nr:hypothetical protein K3495_g8116 [Podosphaera aphanis]